MPLPPLSQSFEEGLNARSVTLNPEQRRAVSHVAIERSQDTCSLPIIDGPPGSGKTTVAAVAAGVYLLRRANVRWNCQVVMLSYTNTAADQTTRSLQDLGAEPHEVVRLTERVRLSPEDIRDFAAGYDNIRDLSDPEIRRLRQARVLVTTVLSARKAFDLATRPYVIMDEVSQISVPLFYATIALPRRRGHDVDGVALIGDPQQLPVVTHQEDLEENIATFLLGKGARAHQLVTQHRMHTAICGAVNALRSQFGGAPLISHPSIASRTLLDLYGIPLTSPSSEALRTTVAAETPFVLLNTDFLPGEEVGGSSAFYAQEADIAVGLAQLLQRTYQGLEPVLVTPYSAQREVLYGLSNGRFPVYSVHETQGQEYDCVILSLVRKNASKRIGFLSEQQALGYVGSSRARAKLIVLMSRDTFGGYDYFARFIQYAYSDQPGTAALDLTEVDLSELMGFE